MSKLILALSSTIIGMVSGLVFGQGERFDDDRVEAEKLGWVFDYDQAKRDAKNTNRPLLVVIRCVP